MEQEPDTRPDPRARPSRPLEPDSSTSPWAAGRHVPGQLATPLMELGGRQSPHDVEDYLRNRVASKAGDPSEEPETSADE